MELDCFLRTQQQWLKEFDDTTQKEFIPSSLHPRTILSGARCSFIYNNQIMSFLTAAESGESSSSFSDNETPLKRRRRSLLNEFAIELLISEATAIHPSALFFIIDRKMYFVNHTSVGSIRLSKSSPQLLIDWPAALQLRISCGQSHTNVHSSSSSFLKSKGMKGDKALQSLSSVLTHMDRSLTADLLPYPSSMNGSPPLPATSPSSPPPSLQSFVEASMHVSRLCRHVFETSLSFKSSCTPLHSESNTLQDSSTYRGIESAEKGAIIVSLFNAFQSIPCVDKQHLQAQSASAVSSIEIDLQRALDDTYGGNVAGEDRRVAVKKIGQLVVALALQAENDIFLQSIRSHDGFSW